MSSLLKLCIPSGVIIFAFLRLKCSSALVFSSFAFLGSCFKSLQFSASKMVSSAYFHIIDNFFHQFSLLFPLNLAQFFMWYVLCVDQTNKEIKYTLVFYLTPLPTVASCPQYRLHIRTTMCWGMLISFKATHGFSCSMYQRLCCIYKM